MLFGKNSFTRDAGRAMVFARQSGFAQLHLLQGGDIISLRDTTNVLWNGSITPGVGTHVFDHDLYNSWDSNVFGVRLFVMFQCGSVGNAYSMTGRERGGSKAQEQIRSQIAGIAQTDTWDISVDTNGDFEIVIAGAAATDAICWLKGLWL